MGRRRRDGAFGRPEPLALIHPPAKGGAFAGEKRAGCGRKRVCAKEPPYLVRRARLIIVSLRLKPGSVSRVFFNPSRMKRANASAGTGGLQK